MTRWDTAYAAKPVLVVGGLGFIGVNLSRRLVSLAARVTIVTPRKAPHEAAVRELASAGATIVAADVRDAGRVKEIGQGQALVLNMSGPCRAGPGIEEPPTGLH